MFKYVDKKGKRERAGFPEGCNGCQSTIEWDCENCMWRVNHWKYDEVINYVGLYRAKQGGMNLNRIESLDMLDFQKISIVKGYLQ